MCVLRCAECVVCLVHDVWCVAYTLSFVGWYVLVVVNCLMWGVRSLLALSVPSLSNGVRCLLRVVSWLLCIVCCVLYDVLLVVCRLCCVV